MAHAADTRRRRRHSRRWWRDPSTPDAGPGLAAADHAHAALDTQRVIGFDTDMADIGAAVIGIVNLARPFARCRWAHADEQGYPDHRPRPQRGIGILVVELGLARGAIDRLLQPDDDAAKAVAAFGDLDARVALLGQPDADR